MNHKLISKPIQKNYKKPLKKTVIIYLLTWLLISLFLLLNSLNFEVLFTLSGFVFIHVLFIFILLFYALINYLIRSYKQNQLKLALKRLSLRLLLPLVLMIGGIRAIIIYNQSENFDYQWNFDVENKSNLATNYFQKDQKIRGMSVYALGRSKNLNLNKIVKNNVEWLAVHPYFSQLTEKSTKISTPKEIGEWTKRDQKFISDIEKAKVKGFRIMLKPHLWVTNGWRGNIYFDNPKDWDIWFENYKKNILHYATLAETTKSEMFCIGTELESSLKYQQKKWLSLVNEIKHIYSGKLTYAINWDSKLLNEIPEFWRELDFIGIQAYYKLTKNNNPTLEEIKLGWDIHIDELSTIHKTHNRPIIFTELGYRADTQATVKPWEWNSIFSPLIRKKSERTQLFAYEAFFDKVWQQGWFSGVFIWQWNRSSDFQVEDKPAQDIIAEGFFN